MSGESCLNCEGTGRVRVTWDFGAGVEETCSFCDGTGWVPAEMIIAGTQIDQETFDRLLKLAHEQLGKELEKQIFAESPIMKHMTGLKTITEATS